MSLQFTPTIASWPFQSNHSAVQVPQNSDHTLLSHLRLPQTGGPGTRLKLKLQLKLIYDLYIIYKWDIPSIQRKKKIRRSVLINELDRPSLVFIDFNIPAFTPDHLRV
jgi:hypothetical protein